MNEYGEFDNRNIIKVENLNQSLSDEELEKRIDSYKGRIPSVLLDELKEILKGKKITEEQLDRIVKKIEMSLDSGVSKIEDLYNKVESLEKLLKAQKTIPEEKKLTEIAEKKEKTEYDGLKTQKAIETENVLMSYEVDGKARLTKIPENPRGIMLLLKWIEYLIERVGYEGLEDVLNYYIDINWINEDVLLAILRYARGIRLYHENSDWRPAGFMNVQDHLMSLMFIEALKNGKFNKEILMEVEREVYRMKKEVAELHGI